MCGTLTAVLCDVIARQAYIVIVNLLMNKFGDLGQGTVHVHTIAPIAMIKNMITVMRIPQLMQRPLRFSKDYSYYKKKKSLS